MEYQEKIISLASLTPLQPVKLAKELNTTSLVASAMLSDMKSKGKIAISNLKLGSSPLYYLPNKKEQLENYSTALNSNEKKAYDLLKEHRILQESTLPPITKFSLTQIKDFAEQIKATFNEQTEIFWKWYSVNNSEAEQLIKNLLTPKIKEIIKEEIKKEPVEIIEKTKSKIIEKKEIPTQKPITNFDDEFQNYLDENKISILEILSKRSKERDLMIEIPSNIGKLTYFCKIKNKKSITDTDISKAFMQGQSRKLPVLLISNGSLNKRAVDLLDELKGVMFCKV
ncbi:hypothetical protein COV11_02035 [Candidatus Woesearchaeota archaeon CG10_big_fil_rev_8_21_14_0_10_30_7]|nr:MAG: hypothetical protein COV11_02035 [Candidatus Woesearchaeota archaeon CG10_big_fil_rev_8_21_14_0_10_30_7]